MLLTMNEIEDCGIVNVYGILEPGERIIWQGQPQHLIKANGLNISLTIIGLALFFAAGSAAYTAITENMFYLFLAVVLGLTGYMFTFYRLINLYKHNKHTFFILTDKRAIEYITGEKEIINAHKLSNESITKMDVNRMGNGSIKIEPTFICDAERNHLSDTDPDVDWMKGFNPDVEFKDIEEADTVYVLINSAIKDLNKQLSDDVLPDSAQNLAVNGDIIDNRNDEATRNRIIKITGSDNDEAASRDTGFIQHWLRPGENSLWQGQPNPRFKLTKADVYTIPLAIFYLCFAIAWTAIASYNSLLFALFGIPFICAGIYAVFVRFFTENNRKRNTFYAVTDERVIFGLKNKGQEFMRELNLNDIYSVEITTDEDGTGTVSFNGSYSNSLVSSLAGYSKASKKYSGEKIRYTELFDIDDAKKVFNLISSLTAGNKKKISKSVE